MLLARVASYSSAAHNGRLSTTGAANHGGSKLRVGGLLTSTENWHPSESAYERTSGKR